MVAIHDQVFQQSERSAVDVVPNVAPPASVAAKEFDFSAAPLQDKHTQYLLWHISCIWDSLTQKVQSNEHEPFDTPNTHGLQWFSFAFFRDFLPDLEMVEQMKTLWTQLERRGSEIIEGPVWLCWNGVWVRAFLSCVEALGAALQIDTKNFGKHTNVRKAGVWITSVIVSASDYVWMSRWRTVRFGSRSILVDVWSVSRGLVRNWMWERSTR